MKRSIGAGVSGFAAGSLNGLFGAGGGMVLVPLMSGLTDLEEQELFPCSIVVLFPICIIFKWLESIPLYGCTLN